MVEVRTSGALVVLVSCLGCGSLPRPAGFRVAKPSPATQRTFEATTNLNGRHAVVVSVQDLAGRSMGTYLAQVNSNRLSLALGDSPTGTYVVEMGVPGCVPLKGSITTGLPLTTQHLEFVFGDADGDGTINQRDISLLKRWASRGKSSLFDPEDPNLCTAHSDWDQDGRISSVEVSLAERNLARFGGQK